MISVKKIITWIRYELEMASRNGISGLLNFKIFCGSMPPDPPRDWRLRSASGLPPRTQISGYGHDYKTSGLILEYPAPHFGLWTRWSRLDSFYGFFRVHLLNYEYIYPYTVNSTLLSE